MQRTIFVSLLLASCLTPFASAGTILFQRPLPNATNNAATYVNGAVGPNRSNYVYRDYSDQGYYFIPGDDFKLKTDAVIDSLTVWGVANAPLTSTAPFDPGSEFDQLNLYMGSPSGDLTWQTDQYTAVRDYYQPGNVNFESQDGLNQSYAIYKITFTGLNIFVPANTLIGFAIYPIPLDPAFNFALHSSVNSLTLASGVSPFDGPDGLVRYFYYNGNVYPAAEFSYSGSVDKFDADANVIITGTAIPEPATFGLLGAGLAAFVYLKRRA